MHLAVIRKAVVAFIFGAVLVANYFWGTEWLGITSTSEIGDVENNPIISQGLQIIAFLWGVYEVWRGKNKEPDA